MRRTLLRRFCDGDGDDDDDDDVDENNGGRLEGKRNMNTSSPPYLAFWNDFSSPFFIAGGRRVVVLSYCPFGGCAMAISSSF